MFPSYNHAELVLFDKCLNFKLMNWVARTWAHKNHPFSCSYLVLPYNQHFIFFFSFLYHFRTLEKRANMFDFFSHCSCREFQDMTKSKHLLRKRYRHKWNLHFFLFIFLIVLCLFVHLFGGHTRSAQSLLLVLNSGIILCRIWGNICGFRYWTQNRCKHQTPYMLYCLLHPQIYMVSKNIKKIIFTSTIYLIYLIYAETIKKK